MSPDGKKNVTTKVIDENAERFPTRITVRIGSRRLVGRIRSGLNAQVLWSPDSSAFAVTGSAEGGNGNYYTDAFVLGDNGLARIPLTSLIWRAFGHPVKCGWPEYPNVAVFGWLEGSKYLLVAAQIINHSNCDSFATFKGYQVDLAGRRVVRVWDQIKTKKLFGAQLGAWLMDAPDDCIRKPSICFVSTNHPERQRNCSRGRATRM